MPVKTLPSASPTTGTLLTLTPTKARLSTVKEIRLELARLYRETKAGHINPADAAKLAFILDRVRVCIVDHELEARVLELELLSEEKP